LIYWSMDRSTPLLASDLPSDRLSSLAHNLTNLVESLRWRRMLRIVQ